MSKPMTFEERFEKVMDNKAEVYAEETNDYYIIHGKRKSIYETYTAAVEDLKPIIIELRECLVKERAVLTEELEYNCDCGADDWPNGSEGDCYGHKRLDVIEKTLARLDDFFGGG